MEFLGYHKEIYPSQLTVEKANKSDLANYLDLDLKFVIEGGSDLSTSLYERRDDFDLHLFNFIFLSNNIPSDPFYGVYNWELRRYARRC